MRIIRKVVLLVGLISFGASPVVSAQELGRYRNMRLGSELAAVAKANGLTPADAHLIHGRPATLHDLEWRSGLLLSESRVAGDPVKEMTFSFYNDQLFRIIVRYDHQRVEGLTDADLINVITTTYGTPARLTSTEPGRFESAENRFDESTVVARWEDAETSITLLRSRFQAPVNLVVISKRLAGLAQFATAEAKRLDRLEEPQRELDRMKRDAEAVQTSEEKARPANKAAFRP